MSRVAQRQSPLAELQSAAVLEDPLHAHHEALWLKAWRIVLAHMIVALVMAMVFAPPRVQAVVAYSCSVIMLLWVYFGDALLWRVVRR
jgi:hypothetical protein